MIDRAKFFSRVAHSTPGKLLRALLAAQQLAGVCQLPAVKALSAMASPPAVVHAGATPAAEKYHGELHARYCDGRSVSTP